LAAERESSRLLYVALTRARDRLILCGVESQRHRYERSWRDYMQRAFDELAIHPFALAGGGEGWRYGVDPVAAAAPAPVVGATFATPAWVRAAGPPEPAAARYASPSALDDAVRTPAPSPLAAVAGLGRFRRGDLIHRLLQVLPDLRRQDRPAAALRWMNRERDLTDEQRAEMADAALAVLGDRRFAAVFGPGSKAEVALAGTARGLRISGRVDRLVVEVDRVVVVDFKTNRPAPKRIEDADDAYLRQMALYVTLLREVYPGRTIEAALVWTDGPKLMPVPARVIDDALADLAKA
jgi:ATP-dependent helicase/nuclease subunit A